MLSFLGEKLLLPDTSNLWKPTDSLINAIACVGIFMSYLDLMPTAETASIQ
ncbi:hypothetical protein [Microcoleus sp. PH2017_40_RAT_O_B]|uniref:hypothetical protein n=1 Tax=Microcoleus sp. PH2017_40_RAT_O_B TaxID=2798850 RepID=UPI001DE19606|nr:hypothetical protein [Microcoleus sp. PH2017_40_RAT_O_B]MCC3571427.1 hypothetical protein [Microcoleus sp. PH2017_34_RAT_O_A]MCC3619978.1 hypothetical protein [Microcoleus sp. PH2017_38_RDM_U_B]